MASPKTTPLAHPQREGLESAVRDGVRNELDRRGVGGGGGDDRIAQLERDVAVIKATMVTKDSLESELGKIRLAIEHAPITLLKWLGSIIAFLGTITAIVYAITRMTGSAG